MPLVGIPMYGDQPDNIAKAVHRGFGLLVPAKQLQVGLFFQASLAALVALQSIPQDAAHLHRYSLLPALLEGNGSHIHCTLGFQTAAGVSMRRALGLVRVHQTKGCWLIAVKLMFTLLGIVQAESLRAAVMRVATEPAFRRAARVVGARMRAHRVTPQQRAAGAPPRAAPDPMCAAKRGCVTVPALLPGALLCLVSDTLDVSCVLAVASWFWGVCNACMHLLLFSKSVAQHQASLERLICPCCAYCVGC